MIIRKKSIYILGIILLFSLVIASVSFASQQLMQNGIDESLIDMLTPDELEAHMKAPNVDIQNNYVGFYGNAPNLSKDYEEYNQEQFDRLYDIIGRIGLKKLKQHSGLVIGQGVHVDGYFLILLRDNPSEEVMGNIYQLYRIEGEKGNINDIAVAFQIFKVKNTSRTSYYRPIIGGIQVSNLFYSGTIGFPAKIGSTEGYLASEHLFPSTFATAYQPSYSLSAGSVSAVGGTYADASFISFSNVTPKIYITNYSHRDVIDYYDPMGTILVSKSGLTTDLTSGNLIAKVSEIEKGDGVILKDQWFAEYYCEYGDSGAPVYTYTQDGVNIHGIHWGRGDDANGNFVASIFSPVSGIYKDLYSIPLTK